MAARQPGKQNADGMHVLFVFTTGGNACAAICTKQHCTPSNYLLLLETVPFVRKN
jgi:hypothetical protein